jgi:hypothetical protein
MHMQLNHLFMQLLVQLDEMSRECNTNGGEEECI